MGNPNKRKKTCKRNKSSKAKKLQWKIRKAALLVNNICTKFSEDANKKTALKICKNVNNDNNSAIPGSSNIACHFDIPASPNPSYILQTTTSIIKSEVQFEINRNRNWCLKTYSAVKNQALSSFQLSENVSTPKYEQNMDDPLNFERIPKKEM